MSWTPYDSPEEADALVINGVTTPGIAYVTRLTNAAKLCKVEPYGARGARIISLGRYLMEATVTIELADSLQYEAWVENIQPIITAIPIGPKGKPMRIEYPLFAAYGVTNMLRGEIRGPTQDGDLWIVELDLTEWIPIPRPALSAPTEAPAPVDNDPVNEQIRIKAEATAARISK
jgi:hypothetical protein